MARKSRKTSENISKSETIKKSEKTYRTAIYVRLSVEDERKIECESVENQVKLLRDYVAGAPDLDEADLYVDRGITGTKFDRPEFNRMIADMRAGKLDCIVVKDLSRLGRNYLEAGNYLESIFPIFGIRFISVTDRYDSLTSKTTEDGLIVPLKNLINEAYAKDISKKVSSSVLARQKQGKHIAGKPPYGYRKDPADPHHLIIDESVSPIVVRIFEERLAGKSFDKIAAGLNDEGIPSPGQVQYKNGYYKNERYKDCLWSYAAIRKLLMNRCYIGDMVQGRTRKAFYKGQPKHIVPEEEYIIVEGTHDPIISRDVFDRMQKMFEETRKEAQARREKQKPYEKPENFLDGLLVCGDCGRRLKYTTMQNKNSRIFYYTCPASVSYGDKCSSKSISKRKMDAAVLEAVKQELALYGDCLQSIRKINAGKKSQDRHHELIAQAEQMKNEIARISVKSGRLYEDFAEGMISEEDYLFVREEYRRKSAELEEVMNKVLLEAEHYEPSYGGDRKMSEVYEQNQGCSELSKEVVDALVKEIRYFGKGRMEICFRYEDEMQTFVNEVKERCGDGEE